MDANSSVVNQPLSPPVNQPAEPPPSVPQTPAEPTIPPVPPTPTPPVPTNIPVVNPEPVSNPPPETPPTPKKKLQFLDKKKLASYGLAAFSFFFLSTATFFTLKLINNNFAGKQIAKNGVSAPSTTNPNESVAGGQGEYQEILAWNKPYQLLATPNTQELENISQGILAWQNNQRDNRGIYVSGYRCIEGGACSQQDPDNRVGLAAIWGRFKNYQINKDPNDLSIITNDLNLYSDKAVIGVMQNNLWNCNLMYDLWQSALFSSEQKTQLEQICFESKYPALAENASSTDPDLKSITLKKTAFQEKTTNLATSSTQFVQNAAFVSDFVARYLWKNKQEDLSEAKKYFNLGVDLYNKLPNNEYVEGKCVLGLATIDLYSINNDASYLDFAEFLLTNEGIEKLITTNPQELKSHYYNSLFDQTTCGLFLERLEKLTKQEKYRTLKDTLIINLINYSYSVPEYKDNQKGQGTFFSRTVSQDKNVFIYRPVRENGLLIGLLANLLSLQ
jgi:hypothetical protein